MANGWSELGAALAGGGGAAQRAYDTGMLQGSRQAGLLEDARMKRDKNMGLEAITPQLLGSVASGRDPITGEAFAPEAADSLQGQLLNGLLHAGIDPRQFSGYQKDQQGIGFGNRAMEVAMAPHPDLNLLNRLNMVREGKPVDLSTIKDGTLLSAMVTPDQQAAVGGNTPTEVGLASIMLKGAQAGASRASAADSYAAANLRNVQAKAGGFSHGAGAGDAGKPPSGYRYTEDGSLTFIPGGPADPANRKGGGQVVDNGDGTTTFVPGSNANSQERNAAGFYHRMVSADAELDALTNPVDDQGKPIGHGYDPTNIRDKLTVGGFANAFASPKGQQYHQAAQNWVRANLRKESGAAIGAAEMDQEIANYFPQIGDSDGVIKQKSRNRKVVEDAMRLAAGRALAPVQPGLGDAATAPPAGHRVGDIITVNGKQYRVTGGDPNDPDVEAL